MDWTLGLKWCYQTGEIPYLWFIAFLLLLVLAYVVLRNGKDHWLNVLLQGKILRWLIAIICLSGLVLYTLGFNHDGSLGNFIAVVPRAFLSALQMFLSQSDMNDVAPMWKSNPIYVSIFSVVHFMATMITALLIIKMIGFRLRNWVRFKRSKSKMADKKCYVLWGLNQQSYTLARDIKRFYEERNDDNFALILVKSVVDDFGYGETQSVGIERIFNVISLQNADIKQVEDLDAIYVNCDIDLSDLELPKSGIVDVFEKLRLGNLGKLVRGCQETHIFFLSENECVNISEALNMLKDNKHTNNTVVYCHAQKESINEAFVNGRENNSKSILRIIDSSYLSVMQLKRNGAYNPVNFLNIDRERAVVENDKFTSLIIGFGETGLDALKFLYEFGALPVYNCENKVVKCGFHCCAIDENMDKIRPQFYKDYPALLGEKRKDEVKLVTAKVGSEDYWKEIEVLVAAGLKYVIVALGDDELCMSVTKNLYNYVSRMRGNEFGTFKIFMRVHKMENEVRMNEFKRLYNDANKDSGAEIVVLGCMADIFNYEFIINDSVKHEADKYKARYDEVTSRMKAKALIASGRKESEPRKEEPHQEKKAQKKPNYIDINNANRKALQNIANSLHCTTKMALINDSVFEKLLKVVRSRDEGSIVYEKAKTFGVEEVLRNLAIAEHLRWVASHEMLGYTVGEEDNHCRKTHSCMVDWEDIKPAADGRSKEELMAYDCDVVDTTIELQAEKFKKKIS